MKSVVPGHLKETKTQDPRLTRFNMNQIELEVQRLVTYRDVQPLLETKEIWTLKLAKHGFSYTGQGSKVRCESCSRELSFDEFLTAGTMQEPCLPQFHASGCGYTRSSVEGGQCIVGSGTRSVHNPDLSHTTRDLEVNTPTGHPLIGSMTSLDKSTVTLSGDVTTSQEVTPTSLFDKSYPKHVQHHEDKVIVVNNSDTPPDRTDIDTSPVRRTEEHLVETQRGASGAEMVIASGISAVLGNSHEKVKPGVESAVIG